MDIESAWRNIIVGLGYKADGPHLSGTPKRVARFMEQWHTVGKEPPKLTTFPNAGTDELVIVGGIRFHSMCAHHGLPFFGVAAVGYIPEASIVGLSKLARVVDHFARRFQVQEELTAQIAGYLETELRPVGVGVVMQAEHLCMAMRGIERPGHRTTTSDLRGALRGKPEARAEFLALLG